MAALAGCAHAPTSNPTTSALPSPATRVREEPAAEPKQAEPADPSLPRAIEAFAAAGLEKGYFSDEDATEAMEHGVSQPLVISALEEIAETCRDQGSESCGGSLDTVKTRRRLIRWLELVGDEDSLDILLRLDGQGEYRAGIALEEVLERRAAAQPTSCTPPQKDAVETIRASLSDFAVFDQRGKKLVARPLTSSEAGDLAYFLAAVELAGTPVGTDDESFTSGTKPSEAFGEARKADLENLTRARFYGDTDEIVRTGVAYLAHLGFPGQIDRSLEGEWAWGGARYSYVMRDVALAAEVSADHQLASALYRRANPGGGACGTSVSSRRGGQIKGLIRSADAAGRCNEVVAERLLDRDGDRGPFYGPDHLATAGFDIARLYRGAFLTRHRDLPQTELLAAVAAAPADFALAARARIEAHGVEAWETRVWAIEGLADTLGYDSGFELAAVLPLLHDDARRRAIEAIGAAGSRYQIGPCDEMSGFGLGMSWSSQWSRPVQAFGTSCETSYSDEDAKRLYRSLRPYLRSKSADLRSATVRTLSSLGAVTAARDLRKLHARNTQAVAACDPEDDDGSCYSEQSAVEATKDALEHIQTLRADLRDRTK